MMVQDKKTKVWYDPDKVFKELMESKEAEFLMKRLKNK